MSASVLIRILVLLILSKQQNHVHRRHHPVAVILTPGIMDNMKKPLFLTPKISESEGLEPGMVGLKLESDQTWKFSEE